MTVTKTYQVDVAVDHYYTVVPSPNTRIPSKWLMSAEGENLNKFATHDEALAYGLKLVAFDVLLMFTIMEYWQRTGTQAMLEAPPDWDDIVNRDR